MSTPINPNQPHGAAQGPYRPQGSGGPQGAPYGATPQAATPFGAPTASGSGRGPALDSAAPGQARLPQRLGDDGKNTPIGFGRLLTVELRKMVDTRAGKWLMGITVALIVVASAIVAINTRDDVSFYNLIGAAIIPLNYLVPVLGILAVTSEWSQRTGLVTFTLEPRRSRVALAKLVATLLLAAIATLLSLASAALFTSIMGAIGSGEPDWHLKSVAYATLLLYMFLQAGMGIAFGMLLQNTPGAICAFLFIPIIVSFLNLMSWGQKAAEWINPNQAFGPLTDGSTTSSQWGKVAVCALLWLAVPLVLGFIRLNKREVKSS